MCFLWSLIVVSVTAKQLKAGCCFNAIELYRTQTGEQSMMLWEKQFFRGLLHDIGISVVQERVHTGCHMVPE